jgi:putative radical SAM enzyme (TIGR03279 family)
MMALSPGDMARRAEVAGRGITVNRIRPQSPAARAGLLAGDVITRIDGEPVTDFLDLYAASLDRDYALRVHRSGGHHTLRIVRERFEDAGLGIDLGRPIPCTNRCVFCFVDQLPRGLRKQLYIKDEDYRLSFLHGNYMTLTNLTSRDERRIVSMHLSPLYVSVHSTDEAVRSRLLARESAEGILSILDRLGSQGIRFHTQIVVVPGLNDGEALRQAIKDLSLRSESVLSLSVVPVGLTNHRQGLKPLRPVAPEEAREIVGYVDDLNRQIRRSIGRGLVYASDELLLLAKSEIPPPAYYDDYPQIENGVGLVRRLMDSMRGLNIPGSLRGRRLVFVTGRLAQPFIERIENIFVAAGVAARTLAAENTLFGPMVTVSGLVSGRDIVEAVSQTPLSDLIVLPPNVVNEDGLTLDDMNLLGIEDAIGIPVIVGDYDMTETAKRIHAVFNRQR